MAGLKGIFFDTSVLIAGTIDFGRSSRHALLLMGCLEDTDGGAEGIRTLDPHVANVVLSQLSYCPTREGVLYSGGRIAASSATVSSPSLSARTFARSPISSSRRV